MNSRMATLLMTFVVTVLFNGPRPLEATKGLPETANRIVAWRGGTGDSRWSNPANWEGGAAPRSVDIVRLSGEASVDAFVDPSFAGTVAGVGNQPNQALPAVNEVLPFAPNTFTRTMSLTLNSGEDFLSSAVIDTDSGFAYFVAQNSVVKIRLSDFTRIGALSLGAYNCYGCSSFIDTLNGYAYFASFGGFVARVRLSDFTFAGVLPLNGNVYSAVIDVDKGFAYINAAYSINGTSTIVKVRLSDFTIADILSLNTNEIGLSAVIDTTNGFAYFGTYPGQVVKVRLSDFTRVGALPLNAGSNFINNATIDIDNGFAYFSAATSPVTVVKVHLSDFTREAALSLNTGENSPLAPVIDIANGFAYFGTNTSPGRVVKVRLSDFTRVGALILNPGENALRSGVIDAANGFAYFGTATAPGQVVKVNIGFAGLVLTHSADPITASVGDSLTYTLSIANASPITATGLMLTDTLPLSVTFVSATTGPTTCSLLSAQVICGLGTLAVDASTQVTIQVTVASSGRGVITSMASVTANEPRFNTPQAASASTIINPLHMFLPAASR